MLVNTYVIISVLLMLFVCSFVCFFFVSLLRFHSLVSFRFVSYSVLYLLILLFSCFVSFVFWFLLSIFACLLCVDVVVILW
jgi:hypothetical protein